VSAALGRVASGGTVLLHAGTHSAFTFGPHAWDRTVTLRPAAGAEDLVVLGAVTLRTVENLRLLQVRTTAEVTIDGGRGVSVVYSRPLGVIVKNGASGISIAANTIVGGWNGVAVVSWNGAPRPSDVRISGNNIYGQRNDNIQIGIADDVIVEDNHLRDPVANEHHNDGIQFMGGERLIVRRNRISGQDQAILLQPEPTLGAGNRVAAARIENNLISRTRGAGVILSRTIGTSVVNNTIYDTPYASVHLAGNNATLRVFNNVLEQLWRESGATAPAVEDQNCIARGGTGAFDVKASPAFIDRIDYRLSATSPCRDIGRRVGAPHTDLDLVRRSVPLDAGAREA
jgi:parallel beta-helix repeat protein